MVPGVIREVRGAGNGCVMDDGVMGEGTAGQNLAEKQQEKQRAAAAAAAAATASSGILLTVDGRICLPEGLYEWKTAPTPLLRWYVVAVFRFCRRNEGLEGPRGYCVMSAEVGRGSDRGRG